MKKNIRIANELIRLAKSIISSNKFSGSFETEIDLGHGPENATIEYAGSFQNVGIGHYEYWGIGGYDSSIEFEIDDYKIYVDDEEIDYGGIPDNIIDQIESDISEDALDKKKQYEL